jgi:hypothetical protein
MEDDTIRQLIMEKQRDNRIACKTAVEIADATGIPRRKIGEILDEMKIKIHSCQLGCFE